MFVFDVETLGIESTCVILSAGLIYFTYGSSIAYLIGAIWLIFPALVLFGVKQSSVSTGLASAN